MTQTEPDRIAVVTVNWIKTSDRLPTAEDGEWVLVVSLHDGPVVDMNRAEYVGEMADTYPYWMKLPELPTMEDANG